MSLNAQALQGQWNDLRGKVKEKWGQLTDDDLAFHGGNVDQLVGKIQKRTGEARDQIEKFLTGLTSQGGSVVSQATETVGRFAQQAGERFRDQYGDWSDSARQGYDQAQTMVRHNPGQSVAVAFGIGVVAGVIMSLALRSR